MHAKRTIFVKHQNVRQVKQVIVCLPHTHIAQVAIVSEFARTCVRLRAMSILWMAAGFASG